MRVRGLKLDLCVAKGILVTSHPMRVRGLKLLALYDKSS